MRIGVAELPRLFPREQQYYLRRQLGVLFSALSVNEIHHFGCLARFADLDLATASTEGRRRILHCHRFSTRVHIKSKVSMVKSIDIIIACPETVEKRTSRTWATVELARRFGVGVIIIRKDGARGFLFATESK